jgi:hypothetical protein
MTFLGALEKISFRDNEFDTQNHFDSEFAFIMTTSNLALLFIIAELRLLAERVFKAWWYYDIWAHHVFSHSCTLS